jgi:glucan biosynthesis protein C
LSKVALSPAADSVRQHELDWLRVLAALAVFLQHTLNPYTGSGWIVSNGESSEGIRYFVAMSSGLRMPLMFFVAGMACVLALGRKPVGTYVRERTTKLVVPLVVGLLVIIPVQLLAVSAVDGSLEVMGALAAGSPVRPDGTVFWAHLWFIANVIIATALVIPAVLWLRTAAPRLTGYWARSPLALGALGMLPLLARCVRSSWVAQLPFAHIIDVRQLATSVAYVACGVIVAALPGYGETAVRCRRWSLVTWICLTAFRLSLQGLDTAWAPYGTMLVSAALSWAWVLTAYGYARHHLRRSSPTLKRVAASSYAFYLVHQPLIVLTALLMTPWQLPIWLECAVLGVTAFTLSVAACEAARSNVVTRYALGFAERRNSERVVALAASAKAA